MRFFTADLLERYRSADPAIARAAETEWEAALTRYDQQAQTLEASMPAPLRAFTALLLHDAALQSLARDGTRLIVVLKKDIPPRELVILNYELEGEPVLVPFVRSPRDWQLPARFDFDEIDQVEEAGQRLYVQSIVFDNGWELRLRFRDVRLTLAEPWTPVNVVPSQPSPAVSHSG